MKQLRLLLSILGFIFATGLALGMGRGLPPVYANVTLGSFTATYLPEDQEIRIDWETATELDVAGFYVARSDSSDGPFQQVSPYYPHRGDTIVGATYVYTDRVPVLNQTYYYLLEAVNANQTLDPHGPISVTAGVPNNGNTRTPTATSTPTSTPTSTATPTTQPGTDDSVSSTSSPRIDATPRPATGATITPQPTFASNPSSPIVFAAASTPALATVNSQPTATIATSALPLSNASPLATAVSPPLATNIMQASGPALVPAEAIPGVAEPVVVATEAALSAEPGGAAHGEALVLIVAAILFLGIAFVILREARQ